ncbi:MAG: DUF6036 family nucleotidyltransferase [Planctomycetota bacterium]
MRDTVTFLQIEALMRELGRRVREPARVYFVGGTTAVMFGWRASTIDIDVRLEPDRAILAHIPELKRELRLNIELASPADFVPELPGWEARSIFIAQHGLVTFLHYDFYGQILAKIERGFEQDLSDADAMARGGHFEANRLLELFRAVEGEFIRFPAIDHARLGQKVRDFCGRRGGS